MQSENGRLCPVFLGAGRPVSDAIDPVRPCSAARLPSAAEPLAIALGITLAIVLGWCFGWPGAQLVSETWHEGPDSRSARFGPHTAGGASVQAFRSVSADYFCRFAARFNSAYAACFETSLKSARISLAILTISRSRLVSDAGGSPRHFVVFTCARCSFIDCSRTCMAVVSANILS